MNALPTAPTAPTAQRARRLDRLTALLLLAAVLVALFPAVPAALHLVHGGGESPVRAAETIAQLLPRPASPHADIGDTAESDRAARRAEAGDDDDGAAPRAGRYGADPDDDATRAPRYRMGLASRGLTLFDAPGSNGARVGEIAAGELVMVVKESGDWALIMTRNDKDGVVQGWAPRSEIAIR